MIKTTTQNQLILLRRRVIDHLFLRKYITASYHWLVWGARKRQCEYFKEFPPNSGLKKEDKFGIFFVLRLRLVQSRILKWSIQSRHVLFYVTEFAADNMGREFSRGLSVKSINLRFT
jgi:hypothetical protein